MYRRLCNKQAFVAQQSEVSQAVAMEGYNTVNSELVMFSGGTVNMEYEESNDLENWTSVSAVNSISAPYTLLGSKTITCAYVRMRCTENEPEGATALVSYGINLSAQ